jgi:SAM-dependent methyltransferase
MIKMINPEISGKCYQKEVYNEQFRERYLSPIESLTSVFNIKVQRILRNLQAKNLKVIDIGCGNGEKALTFAKNNYVVGFEHVLKPLKLIEEVSRVLRNNGRAIIYTENQKRFLTYGWWYKLLKPKQYAEMLKQVGHSEDRFFNVFSLKSDLEMRGIKVEKVIYVFGVFSWIYDLGVLPLLINLGNKLIRKRVVEYSTLRTREVSRVSLINTLVKVYNVLATPFLFVLEMLDKPFEHFGISDGIILLAKKEKAG